MPNTNQQLSSQERQAPELVQEMQQRLGVAYYGTEATHAALLVDFPDLLKPEPEPAIANKPENAPVGLNPNAPAAHAVVDLAVRRKHQEELEEEQHLNELRERIERLTA